MQLLALYCLDHLMLWDFLTLITTAIVYRYSKLDNLHTAQVNSSATTDTTFSVYTKHNIVRPLNATFDEQHKKSGDMALYMHFQGTACGQGVLHLLKVDRTSKEMCLAKLTCHMQDR